MFNYDHDTIGDNHLWKYMGAELAPLPGAELKIRGRMGSYVFLCLNWVLCDPDLRSTVILKSAKLFILQKLLIISLKSYSSVSTKCNYFSLNETNTTLNLCFCDFGALLRFFMFQIPPFVFLASEHCKDSHCICRFDANSSWRTLEVEFLKVHSIFSFVGSAVVHFLIWFIRIESPLKSWDYHLWFIDTPRLSQKPNHSVSSRYWTNRGRFLL